MHETGTEIHIFYICSLPLAVVISGQVWQKDGLCIKISVKGQDELLH
jgi:hypothetical protein